MEIRNLDKWVLPVYHKHMRDYNTRVNVHYGGAGSGKSFFITQKLCIKALLMKRKILVVRKVGATLRDSVWALFNSVLYQLGNPVESINNSDFSIKLINGSVILFKGLDNAEKIKSIADITDIFIEEATELTLDDYTQLNLRLRSKEPYNQIHIAFNPVSKVNWCYKYFFESGTPKNCKVTHTTYQDNTHLPQDYVTSLLELEHRNPAYYKIYALGEFATLDRLVFPVYKKKIVSADDIEGLPRWIGADWGYTIDPTAIVSGYINVGMRKIYVCTEYVKKGMLNDEIATVMKDLGLHKDKSYGDSAEPKSIDELRRYGINIDPAVKGADSVIHGIQFIQQYELIVDERCFKVIEELENYTWKKDKKTGEYVNEPVDTFNHTIDAIRYGLNKYIKGVKTPTVIKKPRGL